MGEWVNGYASEWVSGSVSEAVSEAVSIGVNYDDVVKYSLPLSSKLLGYSIILLKLVLWYIMYTPGGKEYRLHM